VIYAFILLALAPPLTTGALNPTITHPVGGGGCECDKLLLQARQFAVVPDAR
jgi:hypothetical protein